MTTLVRGQATKILLLNPNSSSSMTDGMKAVIKDIDLPDSTEIHIYTAPPTSPASINDAADIQASTTAVLASPASPASSIDLLTAPCPPELLTAPSPLGLLTSFYNDGIATCRIDLPTTSDDDNTSPIDHLMTSYDGIVIACFSVHPLVSELQSRSQSQSRPHAATAVTGIFEASVLSAISLLRPGGTWGIVTTGKFWEDHLSDGVAAFLGVGGGGSARFAGVQSTGLNASDYHHGVHPVVVKEKLKAATKRLLESGDVQVIVMGCAGMAGLEHMIREAADEERGAEFAYSILHVIDGVRAGVMLVDQMIRNQRLRPGRKP
ncbi:hydantoin racemase [Nemania serpens]|nr:hydantoin racemase [Nemania serpens]